MNQISWFNQLSKSRINNQQLEFVSNIAISYIHQNTPQIDQIRCRSINTNGDLILYLDARTNLFQRLSNKVSVLWYFPLSREKYLFQCKSQNLEGNDQILEHWKQLDREERKSFHSLQPDQPYDIRVEKQMNDEDKFQCQEKEQLSPNFRVLYLVPHIVEHTKEKMPQVIADSRTKFESVFKPYKQSERYLHQLNSNGWNTQTISI